MVPTADEFDAACGLMYVRASATTGQAEVSQGDIKDNAESSITDFLNISESMLEDGYLKDDENEEWSSGRGNSGTASAKVHSAFPPEIPNPVSSNGIRNNIRKPWTIYEGNPCNL